MFMQPAFSHLTRTDLTPKLNFALRKKYKKGERGKGCRRSGGWVYRWRRRMENQGMAEGSLQLDYIIEMSLVMLSF